MHPNSDAGESLLYKCPLCNEVVDVEEHLIGEMIECPRCERPFQVAAPRAYPIKDQSSVDHRTVAKANMLADDEVVHQVIHPVVFRRHLLGTLIFGCLTVAALVVLVMGFAGQTIFGYSGLILVIPAIALSLVGAGFLVKWYIASRMQSLTLTDERLIYRYGIIQRGTSEVRHEDVRNVKVDENIFERMLGFGDIAVSSAGQDDMEVIIHDIPKPGEVVEFIRRRQ